MTWTVEEHEEYDTGSPYWRIMDGTRELAVVTSSRSDALVMAAAMDMREELISYIAHDDRGHWGNPNSAWVSYKERAIAAVLRTWRPDVGVDAYMNRPEYAAERAGLKWSVKQGEIEDVTKGWDAVDLAHVNFAGRGID